MTNIKLITAAMLLAGTLCQAQIRNDVFWDTADGTPIYSQGGGIFRFTDPEAGTPAYYWYGAYYKEAETYRNDPSVTLDANNIVGITCYRSDDLLHWHDVGLVMTEEAIRGASRRAGWVGRLGVALIEETGQYALLVQHNNSVMIALADKPTGPFVVHKHIDMTPVIGTPNTGDQTVFTDEDTGKDYLVYTYGKGRATIYISEIGVLEDGTIGLKDCVTVFKGAGREGNCMFKYKGRYYMCASNLYGWDSSFAYWMSSDDIYGPYLPTNEMLVMEGCERDYAHITQTGFFYTLRGTEEETVIYCGDRWADFAGNGLGYNQWVPLSFRDGNPVFNSLSAWDLDPVTGRWTVAGDNNYVINASFEADRRQVPIPNKPVQEYLLGWDTKVIKGNAVSLANPDTPYLNYLNSAEDRKQVIGEKSLMIGDSVDFSREVSQQVLSTDFVKVEDGAYTLSLKFRDSGEFEKLQVSVVSAARKKPYSLDLKKLRSGDKWTEASMSVKLKGGSAVITFSADGKAGACCLVDDVSLVRK